MEQRDKSRDYFTEADNDKIIEIMKKWVPLRRKALQEGNLQQAPIPEFVALKVQQIAEHTSRGSQWVRNPNRQEMVSHAVCETLRYIHGFDPERIGERSKRVNFFSYVTGAVKNYFGHFTLAEAEQQYFKDESFVRQHASTIDGAEDLVDTGNQSPDVSSNTDIGRDISERAARFEQHKRDRAERAKQRRLAKQNKLPKTTPKKEKNKNKLF